ncbi:MAG: UvrD-helicase domain-containing protein [Candidatus Doudnabacteria bacterium]|nr:UvrD-helicase domain-containing protein [Candidatus Doudnabacteria bacterium]
MSRVEKKKLSASAPPKHDGEGGLKISRATHSAVALPATRAESARGSSSAGLNQKQSEAVQHTHGPLLIVAGAGTGKTTVLTNRVAWLIEKGLAKPEEILALTFTEKAAAEMEERVDRLLPYGLVDLWISTFHAFGQRILDSHALDIGLPVDFRVLTPTELWVLIKENFDRFDLDYYRPLGNPARFIHALVSHFSRAKDELVSPEDYLKHARELRLNLDSEIKHQSSAAEQEAARIAEVAAAYATYQKVLAENNALDFGDLITYTYQLFQKRVSVLQRYRAQFKFILIDEFQDTNFAQFELIKILAAPHNNITVVGDDDQSIYKFRGASVSNILRFKDSFAKSREVTLVKNYRSTQDILDLAYNFIQLNNPDRLEQKLAISKKLIAEKAGKALIEFHHYADYHLEAEGVVDRIVELKNRDPHSTWDDFAILVRANDTAESFTEVLERRDLPFMHLSRRGLYKKPIILDLTAYLRILVNYHESRSFFRVLNFPVFNLNHDDLVAILDFSSRKTYSVYESLKKPDLLPRLSDPGKSGVGKLLALLEKHASHASEKPLTELVVEVVSDLSLGVSKNDALRIKNLGLLQQFSRKVKDFSVKKGRNLTDFMEVLDMELASGEQGSLDFDPEVGPEAIKIITVHSAKGLEFRYVFQPGLVDKKFPAIARGEPIELPEELIRDILPQGNFHLQEERRLFYVAMTRAKEGLFFTYAHDYGGSTTRKPSRFLSEVGMKKSQGLGFPDQRIKPKDGSGSAKKVSLQFPKTYSFSSVSAFRKCPLEYKYLYLLKLPTAGSAPLSFGQTIHATLENFLKLYQQTNQRTQGDLFAKETKAKKKLLPGFEKLEEFYRSAWVDEWYVDKRQKESYRKRGEEILKLVYEYLRRQPPAPKYLEKPFKIALNEDVFSGKIDRGDATPDGLVIIDYKTGADRPLAKVAKEQLLI